MILTPDELAALTKRTRSDVSRHGGDATGLLGHEDARTTKGYLRGLDDPVVAGPSLKGAK